MAIEYKIDGTNKTYHFSYQEMVATYNKFSGMSDAEFMDELPNILHFACFACYVKEYPSEMVLVDTGILHELIHLLPGSSGTTTSLSDIRALFDLLMEFK